MIVVADSSPLRYLIALRQQELLPRIFGETWLPSAVVKELSAPGAPLEVREFLNHPPEWLKVRDPSQDAVEAINNELDVGERAALALARELGADLILVDDAAARREAMLLRIRITGTVGVLRLAAERGWIDVPAVVEELRRSGLYLSESLIRSAFGQWL